MAGILSKSMQYAFRDRKNKKRNFRSLWISRISAGSRILGVPYSRLINGLHTKEIILIIISLVFPDESSFPSPWP